MSLNPSRRRFVQSSAALVGGAGLPQLGHAGFVPIYRGQPKAAAWDYRKDTLDKDETLKLHAKYPYVVLNMTPSQSVPGAPGYNHVQKLRQLNSGLHIGQYAIMTQMYESGADWQPMLDLLNKGGTDGKGWWALAGATSPVSPGHRTKTAGSSKTYAAWEVNQTSFAKPDALGRRAPKAMADVYYQIMLRDLRSAGMDMVFNDNVWANPGTTVATGSDGVTDFPKGTVADYNLDGNNDPSSCGDRNVGVNPQFRAGYVEFVGRIKQWMPGVSLIANADYDTVGIPGSQPSFSSSLSTTELKGVYEYGFIEALTSRTYSVDTWRGNFADTMKVYRSQVASVTKGVFVNAYLDSTNDTLGRTLQKARYALGVTLLDDGIAAIADMPAGGTMRPYWFNELDAPLWAADELPPTAAWSNGLWRRRYRGGCVVVNPSCNAGRWMGNAPGTLTLTRAGNVVTLQWTSSGTPMLSRSPGELVRIQDCSTDRSFNGTFVLTGAQSVNNGSSVTLTLTWNQAGAAASLTRPSGFFALQTTVDLTGQGYKRILGTDDAHNDYHFGGTSQNDGTRVDKLTLWANDAVVLLKA